MIRNLDIGLLRAFAAAAERRSMTAAAGALNLTQGAVSQQIARLEALAGGRLLVRERAGLRPTPSGERLLVKARRLLVLNDEMLADLGGEPVGGIVRLGVPHDLVGTTVAPALKRFAASCPKVELSLVCGTSEDLARRFDAGALDLVLGEAAVSAAATGERLAVDRLVWTGARGGTAYLREPLPVSLGGETCVFRPAVLCALEREGREWRTVFENGGLDATLAIVRADLAVSAWLASSVPADLDVLASDARLPDLPPFAVTLRASVRPASPAADELARHIREALARGRQAA